MWAGLTLCLLGCGCASQAPFDQVLEPKIGPQVVFADQDVHSSPASFQVVPQAMPQSPPAALMFSMGLEQDMQRADAVGGNLGLVLNQTWQEEGVFPRLVYDRDQPWPGTEQALQTGREGDFDLIVRPRTTYLFTSGSQGSTNLAVHIEIMSVREGKVIWSMSHAGTMEKPPDQDFIVLTRKTRMPASPAYMVMSALARDLAKPVKAWAAGERWQEIRGQRTEDRGQRAEDRR